MILCVYVSNYYPLALGDFEFVRGFVAMNKVFVKNVRPVNFESTHEENNGEREQIDSTIL